MAAVGKTASKWKVEAAGSTGKELKIYYDNLVSEALAVPDITADAGNFQVNSDGVLSLTEDAEISAERVVTLTLDK